ncbi:MAG: hypothetical protein HRU40_10785 [Saprospiraceae bacterium]|nr:hypothetical protein [Saprospiraceae bacterium]
MSKGTSFLILRLNPDVNDHWKEFLTILLNTPNGLLLPSRPVGSSMDEKDSYNEEQVLSFISTSGYEIALDKYFDARERYKTSLLEQDTVVKSLTRTGEMINRCIIDLVGLFQKLESMALVESEVPKVTSSNFNKLFHLTEKGIDVALKLQEHMDNERRFEQQKEISEQQKEISEKLKNNSTTSKNISIFAVVITSLALWLTYNIFEVNKKRLNIAEKNQITFIEQRAGLKNAIKDIAILKAAKLKAQVSELKNEENTDLTG